MSAESITFREARAADADLIAAMNAEVQELHRAAKPKLYKPFDAEAISGFFAGRLSERSHTVLIAEAEGAAVGYASYAIERRPEDVFAFSRTFAHVDQICVCAGRRRHGVGKALLDAVRRRAREAGVDRIELTVHAFNAPARAFFEAQGFRPDVHRLVAGA